jgi:hypothetical protein
VTADGRTIYCIDHQYNPHRISIDGQQAVRLDIHNRFWNVAISPDGTKLAAILNRLEPTIYVMDLESAGAYKEYPLFVPDTNENQANCSVLFADVLEWTADGRHIIYDVLNKELNVQGDTLEYWDIFRLQPDNGYIMQLIPDHPQDTHKGNPALASKNDDVIAFDYADSAGTMSILGFNMQSGDLETLHDNNKSLGYPEFASGDQSLIYEFHDGYYSSLYIKNLQPGEFSGKFVEQFCFAIRISGRDQWITNSLDNAIAHGNDHGSTKEHPKAIGRDHKQGPGEMEQQGYP